MSQCLSCKDPIKKEDSGFGKCFYEQGHTFCNSCMSKYCEHEFCTKKRSFLLIQCPTTVQIRTAFGIVSKRCDCILSEDDFYKYTKGSENVKNLLTIVKKTIPEKATKLEDFNYKFNEKGQLRNIDTGEPFHFVSETHYDCIGDFIVRYIQDKMVKEFDMQEVFCPIEEEYANSPKVNIFMTKNALTNPDKLMVIIQGSGAVRAGQWARALCINEGLETGSILNYLKSAKDEGYEVIVLNPNLNKVPKKEDPKRRTREGFMNPERPKPLQPGEYDIIPLNDSPVKHIIYVWDTFISKAKAKDIVFVAHSAGGHGTCELIRHRGDQVMRRVRAIAFTDSVHSIEDDDPQEMKTYIMQSAANWVTSDKPLGTKIKLSKMSGCVCLSAGHTKHENTSQSCITDVFKFFREKRKP